MTYPRSPVARSYFIHTFGCQMNESDSQRMGEALARAGWRPVATPDGADLVLVNTCAIREKAEDKLYSALGRYRLLKAQRGTRIGVAGCVAQQEKKRLLSRAPFVDFVLGPDHLEKVPELVDTGGVETDFVDTEHYLFPQADPQTSRGKTTAFVTAMKGCDNVCSFCVVPHTRGREVSRSYAEIVGEVASLPGLLRIRFTTSHPMDLSDDLVRCFAEVPQLMPHFHLPVQHGADSVLERMRRRYTIAEYERRIAALPAHVALTSDIICGFPGETDDEHRQNVEFLRRTAYDGLFSFIFSPRPHTGAILKLREWGEVPRGVAIRRLGEVQALQMERTLQRRRARIGATVEVLVEEPGFGRSRENWTVHFNGEAGTGDLVNVCVESASLVALRGVQIEVIDRAPRVELPARRRLAVVSA